MNRTLFNVIFCLLMSVFPSGNVDAWDVSVKEASALDKRLFNIMNSPAYNGEMGHLAKVEAWTLAADTYLHYKNIPEARRHARFSAEQDDPHAQWIEVVLVLWTV